MAKFDKVITHKNKIPKYQDEVLRWRIPCDNSVAFPSGVSTPNLWYKADAATASTDTANKNTVNDNSKFTRIYDFGSEAAHLNNPLNFDDFWWYSSTRTQNGLNTIYNPAGQSSWNLYENYPPTKQIGITGKGTIIFAWHSGKNTSISSTYAGAVEFQIRNGDPTVPPVDFINYGFRSQMGNGHVNGLQDQTVIYGDTQNYVFSTKPGVDNVRVVSVESAGSASVYQQNGVTGATTSYNRMVSPIILTTVGLASPSNTLEEQDTFYEALYWETPLSAADCEKVETYLCKKWCIRY